MTSISWHPAGGVVFICGSRGEVQCVDVVLNPLQFYVVSEELEPSPLLQMGSYYM